MTTITKSFDIDAWRMLSREDAVSEREEPWRFSVDVTAIGPLLDRSGYITALEAMDRCIRPILRRACIDHQVIYLGAKILTQDAKPADMAVHLLEEVMPRALHPAELTPVSVQIRSAEQEGVVAVLPQNHWPHAIALLELQPSACRYSGLARIESPIDNSLYCVTGQETATQRHARKTQALRLMGDLYERPKPGDDALSNDEASL